jgi:hypothetical protein
METADRIRQKYIKNFKEHDVAANKRTIPHLKSSILALGLGILGLACCLVLFLNASTLPTIMFWSLFVGLLVCLFLVAWGFAKLMIHVCYANEISPVQV